MKIIREKTTQIKDNGGNSGLLLSLSKKKENPGCGTMGGKNLGKSKPMFRTKWGNPTSIASIISHVEMSHSRLFELLLP